jgi:uncharacterized protein YciI
MKKPKHLLVWSLVLLFNQASFSQTTNPNYDSLLAQKLGADDYGMKSYVMVILQTGSNTSDNKEERSESFRGHMDNIRRLVEENKLIVAGPFGENDNSFRGIFILNVTTLDEAKELLKSDPAIAANYLAPELYPWYGSAALSEYLESSDKVWKVKP